MLVAALLGAGAEIVIPLLTKAAIDGPIAASAKSARPWLRPARPHRPGRHRPRHRRGAAEPAQAVGAGDRRRRPRAVHARRDLPAPAAARARLPRRVAVRPAAVAGHHGPVSDQALLQLRHRLHDHELGELHRDRDPADQAEPAARAADRGGVRPRDRALPVVRAPLQRAVRAACRTSRTTSRPASRRPPPASG